MGTPLLTSTSSPCPLASRNKSPLRASTGAELSRPAALRGGFGAHRQFCARRLEHGRRHPCGVVTPHAVTRKGGAPALRAAAHGGSFRRAPVTPARMGRGPRLRYRLNSSPRRCSLGRARAPVCSQRATTRSAALSARPAHTLQSSRKHPPGPSRAVAPRLVQAWGSRTVGAGPLCRCPARWLSRSTLTQQGSAGARALPWVANPIASPRGFPVEGE